MSDDVAELQMELRQQLKQLQRTTSHYREKMVHVAQDLDREESKFDQLKELYEEQAQRYNELQREHVLWRNDVEQKQVEVRTLKQELEQVTTQWRKARIAELRNEELEESNRYLERLVITVALSVPLALMAEKSLRSKL